MRSIWPKDERKDLYKDLQRRISQKIILEGPKTLLKILLALDVSYRKGFAYVSAVQWHIERACAIRIYLLRMRWSMPYISGMFFIRELPPIVKIVRTFSINFDLLLLNAAGIAHREGIGLASHAGLYFKKTSVGITERVPYGYYREPSLKRGSFSPLYNKRKEIIGYVYRTQDYVKPIFITPGHLIDAKNAFYIMQKLPYFSRFPEPLRLADIYSKKEFEKEIKEGCS